MGIKRILYSTILAVTFAGSVFAIDVDSAFNAANRSYDDGDYKAALNSYHYVEQNNFQSAALYFNLGNCYFKEGDLGHAILYYMRAQKLAPGDDEIKSNLDFARQFLPTVLEGVKINPVTDFLDSLAARFTLNGIAWISSLFFVALMLVLSARIYFGYHGLGLKALSFLVLILLFLASGLTTYKYRTEYLARKGVIVIAEAKILSGPGADNDIEFTGGAGLTFEVQKELNDYFQVIFENKRKGWINKADAALI